MTLSSSDIQNLNDLLKRYHFNKSDIIEILHNIQESYGFISKDVAKYLSEQLHIPFSELYSIVTFYNEFKTEMNAKNTFRICMGTACKVMNGKHLIDFLKKELDLDKANKSKDKLFGLDIVYCFGACSMAPVVEINGKLYGHVTTDLLKNKIKELKQKND